MSLEQQTLQRHWESHLKRWQSSGLSGRQYCEQAQLVYHCFIYWRRKLLASVSTSKELSSPAQAMSGFVAVRPAPSQPEAPTSGLQLLLPNGLVINNIQSGNLALVRPLLEQL